MFPGFSPFPDAWIPLASVPTLGVWPTARRLSEALGQEDERFYEAGRKGEINERTRLRPLASPQDIMQMDAGHLIALLPDSRAARLRRASPQLFGSR